MKHYLIFSLLLILSITTVSAQVDKRLPRNITGAEAGFDLLHLSYAAGISYERMLTQGNKAALGIKGKYFFRHKNDNIKKEITDTRPIHASQLQLMLKGYLYLDGNERPYGVFLHAGAGAMYTKREMKYDGNTLDLSGFSPGFDFGLGGNIPLNQKTFMQINLSLSVFSGSENSYNSSVLNWDRTNGLIMPGVNLSIGF
jgi:hemolysin activation/secretion protein